MTETEVQLSNGSLTEESNHTLNILGYEMEILQYRAFLQRRLKLWNHQITGQPIFPEENNIINDCIIKIIHEFENTGHFYSDDLNCGTIR